MSIYRHTLFGTNAFLTQNFTQDRRPNGRLLAPTPLTLRGEDLLRKSKDALLRIAKKLCATHTKNPVGLGVKIGGLIEWGEGKNLPIRHLFWENLFRHLAGSSGKFF